jgi:hypothetical protein
MTSLKLSPSRFRRRRRSLFSPGDSNVVVGSVGHLVLTSVLTQLHCSGEAGEVEDVKRSDFSRRVGKE